MIIWIILGVILFLLLSGLVAMLIYTAPIGKRVYYEQLVRTSPEKWGRCCSAPENEEHMAMWNSGVEWATQNKAFMKEVSVENDGLKLYGELYDFGSDRCVVILPGRCESLMYSYYFASPYQAAGMNVLVVDSRCHGKSDGKYSSVGLYESRDLLIWLKHIEKTFNIREFWLHGVCIGSAAAFLAAINKDCPETVKGVVTEGCFVDFRETFKQHMIYEKKPPFPILDLVMYNLKKYAKVNVLKDSPLRAVPKLKCRALFLYGKQDVFSLPHKSQILFDACGSADKKLIWFDKGGHSHLRINNTEKYDNAIIDFVNQ